jgi:NosL
MILFRLRSVYIAVIVAMILLNLPTAFADQLNMCALCGTEISAEKNVFVLKFKDGTTQTYGCPLCGLTMMGGLGVVSADTQDFLSKRMVKAETAYYLMDTEIGFCCEPHWLSFASKQQAEKFSLGFGGQVLTYEEALKYKHHQH